MDFFVTFSSSTTTLGGARGRAPERAQVTVISTWGREALRGAGGGGSLNGASLRGGNSGLPPLTRLERVLGICLKGRAHAKNWGPGSQKMQIKDPPQAGPGGPSPARTRAPFLPRDEAGGRARTTRRRDPRAAQLGPAGRVTGFTAFTRLRKTRSEEVTSEFWLRNNVRRSLLF